MTKSFVTTGSLVVALASAAFGQSNTQVRPQSATPPTPQTAAARCQQDANEYQNKKFADLRAAGQQLSGATARPIQEDAKRLARACADKISVDGASSAELIALASLHLFTADTAKARNVVSLILAKPGTEAERAEGLNSATQLSNATRDAFDGINTDAERFVRQIDEMSDAVLAQKVQAHRSMLGRYEYADIDDGILDHATKLLALSQRALSTNALGMTPARAGQPPVSAAYQPMLMAYSSLARAAADFLHTDSALMILDEAERVLGTVYPYARSTIDRHREMYRLVGSKATPIDGQYWINEKDGASLVPGTGNGKVTFVQFTAHWCVPCKKSYGGMLRMMKRYEGKPVEALLETYLYGYVGAKQNLTPQQEIEEDREYYTVHYGMPFKIAINALPKRDATGEVLSPDTERRYAVSGIPQFVVIDRKGIIRATVVGWDKGNEQRLGALIDKILAEK